MKTNVQKNEDIVLYFINDTTAIDNNTDFENSEKILKLKCERLNNFHKQLGNSDINRNVYKVTFTDYHIEKV